jgi:hypothetical protein
MLSSQEEQAERRRVLANDQRVKEQSGTFLSHTHMDEGARFSQVTSAQIVGADPIPKYPAAADHQRDPVPDEPALGYRIHGLNPSEPVEVSPLTQQAPDPTSAGAPPVISLARVQRTDVGSLSSRRQYRRF